MSKWLNNKRQIHFPDKDSNFGKDGNGKDMLYRINKPCLDCNFCPFGQLIEAFPLKKKSDKVSCKVFGHDCPVFYMAEPFAE